MTQTYKQIQKQIEMLERQAEALRSQEIKGVVDRIKTAIAHYGLTADQLGLGAAGAGSGKSAKKSTKQTASAPRAGAKFADGQGNEWSGRGPRPRWLRDALAAGKSLEEFLTTQAASTKVKSAKVAKAVAATKKPAAKRKAKAHYKDDNGNSWSGMGPRPRWLREALAAGATLEQFAG